MVSIEQQILSKTDSTIFRKLSTLLGFSIILIKLVGTVPSVLRPWPAHQSSKVAETFILVPDGYFSFVRELKTHFRATVAKGGSNVESIYYIGLSYNTASDEYASMKAMLHTVPFLETICIWRYLAWMFDHFLQNEICNNMLARHSSLSN